MAAVAGPSKPKSFFPPPFQIPKSRPHLPSRSVTPAQVNPHPFRSSSISSSPADEDLQKKRHESVQRLRSTWELINEKYGSILPEDDDEIDLKRWRVVKDRGRLRNQERREFGGFEEEDPVLDGPERFEFDSDEDELGAWDHRSGLDLQVLEVEKRKSTPSRTLEDEDDLRSFLGAEAARKLAIGDDDDDARGSASSSGTEGAGWTTSSWAPDDGSARSFPPSRRTSISVGLEDLFPEEKWGMDDASEDELLRDDSDADEATRVVPAVSLIYEVRFCSRRKCWLD